MSKNYNRYLNEISIKEAIKKIPKNTLLIAFATFIALHPLQAQFDFNSSFFEKTKDVDQNSDTIDISSESLNNGENKIVKAVDSSLKINDVNPLDNSLSLHIKNQQLAINGLSQNKVNVIIFNITGKQLIKKQLSATNNTVDINTLSAGVYLLNISDNTTLKFIKR